MFKLAPTRRREKLDNRTGLRRVALSLLFISIFFINIQSLTAQGSSVRVETFNLNPGGQVRIENLRGATRIEAWDMDSVRVVAEKKSPAGASLDPSDLMLMGIQNTITIQCKQQGRPGRIDLTVTVPRGSRIQLFGGTWPVDVNGSLASAVVETTTGAIGYHIPANDDASIAMHSSRGMVRSTAALAAIERTGTQSLQGRLGSGLAPIILNSQAGNITLTPGPNVSQIARAASDAPVGDANDTSTVTGNNSIARSQDYRPNQRRNTRPVYPSPDAQRDNQTDAGDYDSNNGADTSSYPTQRAPRGSGSAPSSGSNTVTFAGNDRSDDESLSVRSSGVFERPRTERRTSGGSSGLRVRIIPSGAALGSARDSGSSIYDQPDDQDSQVNNQSSNSRSRSTQSYDYGNTQRPRPTYDDRDRQSSPRANTSRTDTAANEPDVIASRNTRTGAPPVLRRNDEDAAEPVVPAPSNDSARNDSDEESVVLKAALVNLNVSVTNRSGQALANLKKEDFEIAENGKQQQIEFFQAQSAPFNLVLVLDLSGSIKDKLDVVKSAALRFVDVLGPEDKVAVVSFTHEIRVVSQLTSDRNELKRRIKAIEKPEGGTAFYETMWFTLADTLRNTRGQRNAIVVMTDGVDSSLDRYNPAPTRVTFEQLARRLEEADAMIFPVYLDTEYEEVFERGNSTSEAYSVARDQLERIAELTGGQMFKAEKVGDLSGVYKQVAAAIRTVYSVGYYPTNAERDGTFRRVRVNVNRSDAAVRTKRGYYAK